MTRKKRGSWSKEKCRERYVYGEKITTRSLAKISKVALSTIGKWCSEENWTGERERNQIEIRSETEKKIVEATSTEIADRITQLNEEHFEGFELFRKMAQNFAAILAREIQDITDKSDRQKRVANKDFNLAVQRYSTIFAEMAKMQRIALGMDYEHLNIAMDKVIAAGYEVTNPSVESMIAYLEEEGYSVNKDGAQKQLTG